MVQTFDVESGPFCYISHCISTLQSIHGQKMLTCQLVFNILADKLCKVSH